MYYAIQALTGPAYQDHSTFADYAVGCDINASGDVVGYTLRWGADGELWQVGTIWRSTSPLFSIGVGISSDFFGINAAGDAVGWEGDIGNFATTRPVLVRGGVVTDLSPHLGMGNYLGAINDAGLICVWPNEGPSFVFDSVANVVAFQIPPMLEGIVPIPNAINLAGDVVGMAEGEDGTHGFLYRGGILSDFGPATRAYDINDAGHICGYIWPIQPPLQTPTARIWYADQASLPFTEIPPPADCVGGIAFGINKKGDVVGTSSLSQNYVDYNPDLAAFIYRGGGSTDLNTVIPPGSGLRLQYAYAISDEGQITGSGLLNGQVTAFLLTPLPGSASRYDRLPELVAVMLLGGMTRDGWGRAVLPGRRVTPVPPRGPAWASLPIDMRNALVGLALEELATHGEDLHPQEAVRSATLDMVRSQVDRLLETPQAGSVEMSPRTEARRLEPARLQSLLYPGRLQSSLDRFGQRGQH